MAVRRERVVLELQDEFTSKMARAAAATALLDRELKGLDGSSARAERGSRRAAKEIDNVATSSRKADASINQLTGRLRVLADAAAIVGPSFAPLGAVAVPALTGLASQAGFATLGLGTLVTASQGVGDALKAVNEAALEPTADNLDKAREAMSKIGPEARQFVRNFQELRPVLADIRDSAAAGWFPGLTESLKSLERIAPEVASLFESIGRTGGNLVAEGAAAFAGPEWADFRQFVAAEAPKALDDLGRTLGNVAAGLAELWQAFGPLNRSFSSWLVDASRSFAEWADGLSATAGFQDFVDYIRENGPRVADALGAVGTAVVEIIEAVAPLGGPSLKIIETFADAVSAIADSDIGTPILAGVAALAILNRTLQATAALQTRLNGSTALANGLATGGLLGAGKAGVGGLKAASAELRTIGANWAYLGTSAALAEAKQSKAIGGMAKGAAVLGGLTVAATGAADSIGLTNTTSLALAGSFAGPVGVALGTTAGLLLDIKSAADDWNASVRAAQTAIDTGDLQAQAASLEVYEDRLRRLKDLNDVTGVGDFFSDLWGNQLFNEGRLGRSMADQIGEVEEGIRALQETTTLTPGAGLQQIAYDFANAAEKAQMAADSAGEFRTEIAGLTALLSKQAAYDAYQGAIDDLTESIERNGKTLDANTEKGRENRANLNGIAEAAIQFSETLQGADRKDFLRNARKAFIEGAEKAGGLDKRAKDVLATLNDLIGDYPVTVKGKVLGAAEVREMKKLLDSIHDKSVTLTVNRVANGVGGLIGGVFGSASGGTVPGQRSPYGDKVFSHLAPGEEVISNRHGQADRWRPLLKAINDNAMASGGTVGSYAAGGTVTSALPFAGLPAISTAASLRDLNRALAASTKALDKETQQRDAVVSKLQDLRGTVSGNLMSDLFGQTSPWSSGSSISDATSILRGDVADGRTLQAQIKALKSKGLDSGALASLLANADSETIANFASGSRAQLQQYEAAFNQRASIAAAVGQSAGYAAFGAELKQQTKERRLVANRVERVERAIKAEHKHDRKANRRGAGDGARNRRRG